MATADHIGNMADFRSTDLICD